jgi:ribosome-associated translation inhibitor RaiA
MAEPNIPPVRTTGLNVEFDLHDCELSAADRAGLEADLDPVYRAVEHFPQRDVHILISRRHRSNEYVVKVSVLLPGRTLVCSEHNEVISAAFEKCVRVLLEQAREYKDALGQVPERQKHEKGTHQDLTSPVAVDAEALDRAVAAGDYAAYRSTLSPYEEGLRGRVGRWVERYPELQARMGRDLNVADLLEGVLLAAFEQHTRRPMEIRYGDWLEGLIDPELRALAQHPDEELENIRMARTAAGA